MDINGYEVDEIAFMTSSGPLWAIHSQGRDALLAIRSASDGDRSCERWRAWAGIDCPHVVRLIDVAVHEDGRWAIVQERVRGVGLDVIADSFEARAIGVRRRLSEEVREGVRALHAVGIVHGDLSPANILVTQDLHAVIVDLLDPPAPGSGTIGWSVSEAKTEAEDWRAVSRLDALLGIEESPSPGEARIEESFGRVGGPLDAEELSAKIFADPEAGVRDLRSTAASMPTVIGSGRGRGRAGRRRARTIGARTRVATGAMILLLVVLAATAAWTTSGARSDAEPPGGGESEVACTIAEAQAHLEELLSRRDTALIAEDVEALADLESTQMRDEDRALLDALASEGLSIGAIRTTGEVETVDSCTEESYRLRVSVRQAEASVCDADLCRVIPEQPEHAILLELRTDPLHASMVDEGE